MALSFLKMHGLGNDFVIIDRRDGAAALPAWRVPELADRYRGIGFDQLVYLLPPRGAGANVFLDMYNADGSPLEACGNASRCVARLIMEARGTDSCVIETVAGRLACRAAADGMVTVDMGAPTLVVPIAHDFGHGLPEAMRVEIGNPHAVFFVDDVDAVDIAARGAEIERHALFPNRTNVEFAQVLSPGKIRMRVWERGTGITQACGTGACATLVVAIARNLTDGRAEIILDGGSLFIEQRPEDGHILMTGPTALAFRGEVSRD